jgi:helicase
MPPIIEILDQNDLVNTNKYSLASWEFENFNPVQSRIFEIYDKDINVLIAAKTSAGKTVVAEMFLAHEIRKRGGKGMFLAPLRALAQEKIDQWTDPNYHFHDINISICTGDYRITPARQKELNESNLIIMTSEMLNHRARNINSEKSDYLKDIGTLVIDECHLLTVPGRGEHLEVGLMKFTEINPNCRIILLSATMPNVNQIAEWLSYSLNKKETYVLNSEYRPVPLGLHYENYDDEAYTYDSVENNKIEKAMDIVNDYPEDKFLIFAHTKRTGEQMKNVLKSNKISVEFHNADLNKESRIDLEKRFKNGNDLRVIVATPTLAWGCNLPARRVIILGVHRGKDEVETYNVTQMVGRSGRLGIDPRGDAYVLLPNSEAKKYRDRLGIPQKITSKLIENPRNLAFHLVSEIHHEYIGNIEEIKIWYERSLAYFQNRNLNSTYLNELLEELIKKEIIYEEDGKFVASSIGKISSIFYFSPFDVADLRKNFYFLFLKKNQENDIHLACALSKIDSNRINIVNSSEKKEMQMFDQKLQRELKDDYKYLTEGVKKSVYCYHNLLNGYNSTALAGYQRGLQLNFERIGQILSVIDSMSGKWKQESFFKDLQKRIAYGVPAYLVELCQLPNIGKVRAKKLFDMGFKNIESIAEMDDKKLKGILNMKEEYITEIKKQAMKLSSL